MRLHIRRHVSRAFVPSALASLALVLLACGTASAPGEQLTPEAEIRVVATEWKYDPERIVVPAGTPVKIILENTGNVQHNFAVKELAFQFDAGVGKTAEKVLLVKQPGEYRLICSIPGHAAAGMAGTLVATKPSATASN